MKEKTIRTYEYKDYIFEVDARKNVQLANGKSDMVEIWACKKDKNIKLLVEYISAKSFVCWEEIADYIQKNFNVYSMCYVEYIKDHDIGFDITFNKVYKEVQNALDKEIKKRGIKEKSGHE